MADHAELAAQIDALLAFQNPVPPIPNLARELLTKASAALSAPAGAGSEDAAKVVYEAMSWSASLPGKPGDPLPPWTPGGNSLAQDRARKTASALSKQEAVAIYHACEECGDEWELLQSIDSGTRLYASPVPAEPSAEGWRPIETAPKDRLIDIWISRSDGTGIRWCDCYCDQICDEWRTSRPSGKLLSVKASAVTHWRSRPAPPHGEEG